jgi:hypothetical protein
VNNYTHLELNQDIEALAGHYAPQKEVRLKYDGREVLYVISQLVVDASCCGTANCQTALVPGYIVKWQAEKNKDGRPVSAVEPIHDKAAQDNIRKIIQETEHVSQIEFW